MSTLFLYIKLYFSEVIIVGDKYIDILNGLKERRESINEVAIVMDENKFWRVVNQEYGGDYTKMMLDKYNIKLNPEYEFVSKTGKFNLRRNIMKNKSSDVNKFMRDFNVKFKDLDVGKKYLIPDSDGYLIDVDGDGVYDYKISKDGDFIDGVGKDTFVVTEELLKKILGEMDVCGLKTSSCTVTDIVKGYNNPDKAPLLIHGFSSLTFDYAIRVFRELLGDKYVSDSRGSISVVRVLRGVGDIESRISSISNILGRLKVYDDRLSTKRTNDVDSIKVKLPAMNSDGDVIVSGEFLDNVLGRLGYYGLDINDLGKTLYKSDPSKGHIIIKKEDKGIKGLLDLSRKLESIFGKDCVEYDKLGFIKVAKLVRSKKKAVGFVKK